MRGEVRFYLDGIDWLYMQERVEEQGDMAQRGPLNLWQ